MTSNANAEILKAIALLFRIIQVALVGFAVVFVLGSLMGGVNVFTFLAIAVFALVLLGFAGVVEGIVRVLRGWAD